MNSLRLSPSKTNGRRLLLWDIDGTLVSAGGISKRALVDALVEVFGTAGPVEEYEFSGKTDPQIVRELMRGAGKNDGEIDHRVADALALYRGYLQDSIRPEHVRAKPGIPPLLDRLAVAPGVTLALLTGNIEPCARFKLAPVDLNRHFPFGVYGSDHEDRYQLPALAVVRAQEAVGHRFSGKEIVVIGDSIHDVRCGRSLGVRSVAVASGVTAYETLAAENPDSLARDFSDAEAAIETILG